VKLSKESVKSFLTQVPSDASEKELEDDWLENLTFSQALIVCIGAGPWKEGRRRQVQLNALKELGDRDLSLINIQETLVIGSWYPLEWQNKMLFRFIQRTQTTPRTFESICHHFKDYNCIIYTNPTPDEAWNTYQRFEFLKFFGYETKTPKVISLFIRDKLKFPAFPMDRHVKANLDQFKIPHDEMLVLKLCLRNGVDPSRLNRWIFKQKSYNTNWNKENLND